MRRQQAQVGLSYVDANAGRIVSIEKDVLDIGRRIEERWPELEVYHDKDQCEFIIVEHCGDGVDRFVLARPYLDERLIHALEAADTHMKGQEDPVAWVDAVNDALERDNQRRLSDQMAEAAQRLAFALRKDGVIPTSKVYMGNRRVHHTS